VATVRPRRSCRSIVGRRTAELDRRIGGDVRQLRLDAGVTQRALAKASGIEGYLSQVERGLREPSLTVLQALAIALGADLGVRLYPNAGPAIRDRIQSPILEALIALLHPRWRRLVEVPVLRPVRGVIDAVLHDPGANIAIVTEVESRINRLEQQVRWAAEKADALPSASAWAFMAEVDTPAISRLLVLRSTRATRELAMRYEGLLSAAYPASTRQAYLALSGIGPWPGAAVVWAELETGVATIRPTPPRGVRVGGS